MAWTVAAGESSAVMSMADAIVVGAGLSGLVCAARLGAAGARVVVVEARDRVGGRLLTGRVAGATIDLGGQWMSVGQPRLEALAAELGVATFPQRRDGERRIELPDEARGWRARTASLVAQWRTARRLRRLGHAPPADADALTLAAWLAREVPNPSARALLALHAELTFAADPADLSLLHYLVTLAASGDFAPPGPDLPGGVREHRFAGGAQQLALRLADQLGAAVRLATPITAITDRGDDVRVTGPTTELVARRVVLALPPSLARRIDVALPAPARQMADAARLGPVVKCFAAYPHAFWRDAGRSGEAYLPRGPVRATVALEDPDGGPAILLAFVVGRAAAAWAARGPAERRAAVLATLVAQFGSAAAAPLDYVEFDWGADPWSAGCVAGVGPGVLGAGAAWRAAHGRIHLAGSETARAWPGYMEGAIEAGERAAAEILAAG